MIIRSSLTGPSSSRWPKASTPEHQRARSSHWPLVWPGLSPPVQGCLGHTDATFPATSHYPDALLECSQTGSDGTTTQQPSGFSRTPQQRAGKSRLLWRSHMVWLETALPGRQTCVSLVLKNTSAHTLDTHHGHDSGVSNCSVPSWHLSAVRCGSLPAVPLNRLPQHSTPSQFPPFISYVDIDTHTYVYTYMYMYTHTHTQNFRCVHIYCWGSGQTP